VDGWHEKALAASDATEKMESAGSARSYRNLLK